VEETNQPASVSNSQTITPPEPNKKLGFVKLLGSWAIVLLIAWFMQRFAFQSYQVFGQSMEPTLSTGDLLIISKAPVTWSQIKDKGYIPQRGDIIVLNEDITGQRLIKRVIGLPGERIQITNNKITVYNQQKPNGFNPYKEIGLNNIPTDGEVNVLVPAKHVFVIGDNRKPGGSSDSREHHIGPIPTEQIIGKLIFRFWPFSQADLY
jgi:signal peptidase I